jgi:UDP-N-acetylglucosamine--N-acetylmuramyl-(pentapeptide) pyrophosphoryl-undecaprenol N-acetylglucosamine transferase
MKIVIVGGHLSPALAVIEKLKNEDVFYIGRKYAFEKDAAISLEYQEIIKLGIPFYSINAARLQRKFTKQTIPSLTKFPAGFFDSLKILKQIRPDVVLGFGGYVSLPVILAAFILKIPTVIHEQTSEAGLANKIEAKFVNKVCISWETSRKYFPKDKTVITGNPLGENILNIKPVKKNDGLPVVYVTGGSGGSHVINSLVEKSLGQLLKRFILVHQTGDSKEYNDFERLSSEKNKLDSAIAKNYHLQKFYSPKDMAQNLANADLVVGRAGINTVTELIFLAKPAFLIPLPFAQKNEQLKNAMFLKELGLGEIGIQKTLTAEKFISTILTMFSNLEIYKIKENIQIEKAAENIVGVVKNVSTKKTT